MTSAELEEALSLTVGGIGTAFATLILLALLVLAMKRVFGLRSVQKLTGALAAEEAQAVQRNKAKAAAIAVSAALAEDEARGHYERPEEDSP